MTGLGRRISALSCERKNCLSGLLIGMRCLVPAAAEKKIDAAFLYHTYSGTQCSALASLYSICKEECIIFLFFWMLKALQFSYRCEFLLALQGFVEWWMYSSIWNYWMANTCCNSLTDGLYLSTVLLLIIQWSNILNPLVLRRNWKLVCVSKNQIAYLLKRRKKLQVQNIW